MRIKNFGDACFTAVAQAVGFGVLATFDGRFVRQARRRYSPPQESWVTVSLVW